MLELKPIKSEQDYDEALKAIEIMWDAEPNTPDGDHLEVLMTLVEAYEREHYELPPPNPIAALEYYLESRGLTRSDLEPYIGGRRQVSEVMNRKRPLTLTMIRNLVSGTGIPSSILIQPYELDDTPSHTQKAKLVADSTKISATTL